MNKFEQLKELGKKYPGLEFSIKEKGGFFYSAINGITFSPGYDKEDFWYQDVNEASLKTFMSMVESFALSLINSIRFQKTLDDKSPYKLKSYIKSENGVEYNVIEQKDRIVYYFKDTEIIGRLSGACVETLDGDESNFFYKVGDKYLKKDEYWNHPEIKKKLAKKRL